MSKREVFFLVAVILGLIIGKLIKRMSVGLVFGVLLAMMALVIFSKKRR